MALTFVGLPFVVRTVQPVLQDLEPEVEEAAASLGARRAADVPPRHPAGACCRRSLTGFTLAFARALGEYGSVVFISGNMPMQTEIATLLIMTKLEQYDYAGATAIAVVMLVLSFALLLAINLPAGVGPAPRDGAAAGHGRSHAPGRARPALGAQRRSSASALLFLLAVPASLPLVAVFAQALRAGARRLPRGARRRPTRAPPSGSRSSSAPIAVPLNIVFGVAAAWAIARFEFRGKRAADHAHRPAVRGVAGRLGPDLRAAVRRPGLLRAVARASATSRSSSRCPGIVLATLFVTVPFVARELIPVMEEQGAEEEEAALALGASGWQMFWRVTLPNIRWGLLYGVDPAERARDGRVRRRLGRLRPHPRPDQHDAAARRDPLQRVQLRGGVRRGLAADAAGARRP